jgi:hypothetical protein
MAWRSRLRILIDVSRRAIAADDRRDRAMNAYATELLAHDRQSAFEAEAARDRRRQLAARPANHGALQGLAARAAALARGMRTHHPRVSRPEARTL